MDGSLKISTMLCTLCRSIDFSLSSLLNEDEEDFPVGDVDRPKEYLSYQHHSSIEALRDAANSNCHLCCQIRSELLNIRGHERDEEYHKGPLNIRYYPKFNTQGKALPPKELIVVANTPIRKVKLLFDIVHYASQFRFQRL